MEEIRLTVENINAFLQKKIEAGNKPETIAEYRRILLALRKWLLPDTTLHKETLQQWKEYMQEEKVLAVRTINRRLTVINQFLNFAGERNWQVSCIRLEEVEKSVLSRGEYIRLLQAARQMNKEQIYFIMKTICVLGVSLREFPQVTVGFIKRVEEKLRRGKMSERLWYHQVCKKNCWHIVRVMGFVRVPFLLRKEAENCIALQSIPP